MAKLPKSALTPQQEAAITRLFEHDSTFMVAPLGFGKCVIGQTALQELYLAGAFKRALVIAPLRVVTSTWEVEARHWDHLDAGLFVSAVGGPKQRAAAVASKSPIVMVNFESAAALIKEHGAAFDALLVDELTWLKSSGGELFKVMRPWSKKLKWRAGLTATPVAEHGSDLYGQALILDSGRALGTRREGFMQTYFVPLDYKGYSWGLREGAATQIAQALRGLLYVVDGAEYEATLPPIDDVTLVSVMSPAGCELYEQMSKEGVIEHYGVVAPNEAVRSGKKLQIASGGLYRSADELEKELVWTDPDMRRANVVQDYADSCDEPLIITYTFGFQLQELMRRFPTAPVLGGGRNCTHQDIAAFNAGDIPVLIGHPRSFGMGLNLQGACRTMLHYSPIQSADRYRQVIGRIRRRGQKADVVRRVSFVSDATEELTTLKALLKKETDERALMRALA